MDGNSPMLNMQKSDQTIPQASATNMKNESSKDDLTGKDALLNKTGENQ